MRESWQGQRPSGKVRATLEMIEAARDLVHRAVAVANPLIEQGLVERVPNPAHQRSHLLRLTKSGRKAVDGIERRETKFFQALDAGVRLADLKKATVLLGQLRDALGAQL